MQIEVDVYANKATIACQILVLPLTQENKTNFKLEHMHIIHNNQTLGEVIICSSGKSCLLLGSTWWHLFDELLG